MTIGLIDILKLAGFDDTLPWKLVRHQDNRYPNEELIRRDWFELYQRYQSKPVFQDIKQIASFYGMPGTRAGFYGIYKVVEHSPASRADASAPAPGRKSGIAKLNSSISFSATGVSTISVIASSLIGASVPVPGSRSPPIRRSLRSGNPGADSLRSKTILSSVSHILSSAICSKMKRLIASGELDSVLSVGSI